MIGFLLFLIKVIVITFAFCIGVYLAATIAALSASYIVDERIEENNQKLTDSIINKIRKEYNKK